MFSVLAGALCVGCASDHVRIVELKDVTPPPAPKVHVAQIASPAAAEDRPAAPAALVRNAMLGRSVRGVPLMVEIFGEGPDVVFIFGGIHGNEPIGTALLHRLAEWLRTNPELYAGRTVGLLDAANPDGLASATRGNALGVDLNRNFPARNWRAVHGERSSGAGSAPASEPETRAIMYALELLQPNRILSLHSITRGRQCDNFDGPAEDLARRMAAHNAYPVRANIGYPTPGSFGSWAGIDRGLPTITLELPSDVADDDAWRTNRDALLAFIRGG